MFATSALESTAALFIERLNLRADAGADLDQSPPGGSGAGAWIEQALTSDADVAPAPGGLA